MNVFNQILYAASAVVLIMADYNVNSQSFGSVLLLLNLRTHLNIYRISETNSLKLKPKETVC